MKTGMLVQAQLISYWGAIITYVITFVMLVAGYVFKKDYLLTKTSLGIYLGLTLHSAGLGFRWAMTGHGPYVDFVEVIPADAWIAMAVLIVLQWKKPGLRVLGMFILPLVFLMLGFSVLLEQSTESMPLTYNTLWLYIHVLFAKLAYGSCLVAAASGGLYLWKSSHRQEGNGLLGKIPSLDSLDELGYRFVAFAFIMLGIMILTGAIWAHQSWGRYWGWDPIETWALISWSVYGLILHLRFTLKWKGKWAAWLAIGGFFLVLFSYWATPFIYRTIHEHIVY